MHVSENAFQLVGEHVRLVSKTAIYEKGPAGLILQSALTPTGVSQA